MIRLWRSACITLVCFAVVLAIGAMPVDLAHAAIQPLAMPAVTAGAVLIDEDFTNGSGAFGFDAGASISGGVLRVTQNMGNYTTSVKHFDANIAGQSLVDLAFDWKTVIASGGKKTGIEFRDLYGRLIFAFSGAKGSELRYSTTGWDSDSSQSQYDWEPTWSMVSLDPEKTYTVRLLADFDRKTVSFSITRKDDGSVLVEEVDVPTQATGLARMVASNYYTAGGDGTQALDNFKLIAPVAQLDLPLAGKTMYAFGDSIIDGHKYSKAGFTEFAAAREGMLLTHNGAKNGATIMPGGSGGQILSQIASAPAASPDYVVFDGGTNDAYEVNDSRWGSVGGSQDPATFDTNTVAGAFEYTLYQMKQKWPIAKLVYVAVHRLDGGRTVARQDILHGIELAACAKWGVTVANLYDDASLNTRVQSDRWTYSFDNLGFDGLPGTLATRNSSEFDADTPTGTHPNFRGIEDFYVPFISHALRQIKIVSGAAYKIKNVATGKYLDSDVNGAVILAPGSAYDDQDWIVSQDSSSQWTIRNARSGRYYLDTESTNNQVIWNSGAVISDSLWSLEPVAGGGFRVNNQHAGRDYMYATTTDELKWNTGATDSSAVWIFE